MKRNLPLILTCCLFLSGIFATSQVAADTSLLTVKEAVFRPGIGARPGVVFLKLTNASDLNQTLISVQSNAADKIEIHTHDMKDGMMRMRRLDALAVNANETVILKPHGLHLMVFGYTASETELRMTLSFESGEQISFSPEIIAYGNK